MESKRSTRKRKQPSPSPFEGALTRSKSQIYSFFAKLISNSPNQEPVYSGKGEMTHVSIKDLRSRRVFSHPVAVDAHDSERDIGAFGTETDRQNIGHNFDYEKADYKIKTYCGKKDGFVGNGEELKYFGCRQSEKDDLTTNCNKEGFKLIDRNHNLLVPTVAVSESNDDEIGSDFGQRLDDISSNLSEEEGIMGIGLCNSKQKGNGNGEREENIQTNPPDADIFAEQRGSENVADRADNAFPIKDQITVMPSNKSSLIYEGCAKETFPSNTNPRNDLEAKGKLVLNSCSRIKVFRAPSSFNYRRLLPYLMDISKDKPGVVEIDPVPKNSSVGHVTNILCPKVETCMDEKPSQQSLAFSSQESVMDKPRADETTLPKSFCPSKEILRDMPSERHVGDSRTAGVASQVDKVSSDKLGNLYVGPVSANPFDGSDQSAALLSPSKSIETSLADATLKVPHDVCAEVSCSKNDLEIKVVDNSISLFQSSSNLEVIVPSKVPVVGLAKGILKRNPRGCRGLCSCLHCASFRLHAERAFEFSRNQFQDAEELALSLMTELSCLRNMLQKSVDSVNSCAIIPAGQVKQACIKASNAEDHARNCLSQMTEDLYAHIRTKPLQRPRVSFAGSAKEEAID
ncbi:hypothetical protein Nepgr_009893 [Nepenthes gracilis]|uniref:Uncharacterized protein n=1 Tax=Nepenthes gracilis TaxID=150966 RepID=A0AAD3XKK2_NEPGR|nr:hypothetical protein Nepgr_009893 [Nepenthes gracilis]